MVKKENWDANLPFPELPSGLCVCILSLLAVVSYHTCVNGGFVFDDTEAVVNNGDVRLTTPLYSAFHNDFWGTRITHNASHKSYRPLTVLSFRLNLMLSGGLLVAAEFHLVNLILYTVVCCLSLFVFRSLCGDVSCQRVAFAAAVLFTVHPVHTEAVAPVVGRSDLLSALFMFLAFFSYRRALNDKNGMFANCVCLIWTVVFAAASMFSKEQGITILAVCCAYDLFMKQHIHPRKLLLSATWKSLSSNAFMYRQIMLMLATVTLLMIRWWVMGGTTPTFQRVDNPASFMDSWFFRVVNYLYIYALNVWLLLCPEWLCFDWSMGCIPLIDSIYDSRILVVITFSTVLIFMAYSLLTNTIAETRRILVALSMTLLPFVPASNIFFRVGFVIAERTLLIPSMGFSLLIVLGIRQLRILKISKPTILLCYGVMVLVFTIRSHLRTNEWLSERTLFLTAMSVCPLNAKVHYNLAKTSTNNTQALAHYRDALRLNPDYDQAMNNLANILKDVGELSEAESLLRRAVQLRPDFAAAWMNLGIVLSNLKQFPEAEQCYWNAIKFRKKYPDCFYNLGNLYLELKDHTKAYESWKEATQLDPGHHAAWNNLIIMLDSIGKHDEATSMGQEALKILPDSPSIHFNIANAMGKTSNYLQAERHFKAAIKLNPNYPLYYVNLGVLYHHWKKFSQAKKMYLLALKIDPSMKSAKENLRLLQK